MKQTKQYALLSVFDKTGIIDLAKYFVKKKISIISTGGTAKLLKENKIPFIPIQDITKNPESFDGRMKTISFQVGSGILFDRTNKAHQKEAEVLEIPHIDFVVCNFYDFWKKPGIEMIDVGGPTMVRAAAKNFENVTVIVDPTDYAAVIKNGEADKEFRKYLAAKAFSYVAEYDGLIANYFQSLLPVIPSAPSRSEKYPWGERSEPRDLFISLQNGQQLRYGENPHQQGMFFKDKSAGDTLGLGEFVTLQGKPTSYSNYLDLDGGLHTLSLIGDTKPACVILKHTNPCGAAVADTIEEAYQKAWFEGDPLAAFGGVLFMNRPVTKSLAETMIADKKFFEILAAPSFTKGALEVFSKKPKLQLLQNPALSDPFIKAFKEVKTVRGGYLMQDTDTAQVLKKQLHVVTKKKPTAKQIDDLLFAWKLSQVSKSNCVIAAKSGVMLASGVGQQDRKRCCELCVTKALKPLIGAVAATDGFFPFRDGPDVLIQAGITAIIQPGGSIRDQETIDACNEAGIAMVFTHLRAFKH